jgi:hypothetical protein
LGSPELAVSLVTLVFLAHKVQQGRVVRLVTQVFQASLVLLAHKVHLGLAASLGLAALAVKVVKVVSLVTLVFLVCLA